ncbi:MAG: aminotransferase class IV [Candidatus Kaiserbacteria bacterium]|nr:aminotransferase class IV [Candidatus Kaiserbacteria bacterium]MCB9815914.1 aminotransferase class IV [Candidatus Nomurabacteria bacterium]
MANLAPNALINGKIVPLAEAHLSVASSAVLYGLSVYSVFFAKHTSEGMLCFRIPEHLIRLKQSARMIGLNGAEEYVVEDQFKAQIQALIEANKPTKDQFFRLTVHATSLAPGVRTKDLELAFSVFMMDADKILPESGARLKTSLWRRTTDSAIPARAKVNGAYVNSALAKQDALDAGMDDCLFLNNNGYVSELSAANVFMVKRGQLITPDCASDILEGITRRSVIELAARLDIPVIERKVALTELYTADEVFASGTSAFIAPILEIDGREINDHTPGTITEKIRTALAAEQADPNSAWVTTL